MTQYISHASTPAEAIAEFCSDLRRRRDAITSGTPQPIAGSRSILRMVNIAILGELDGLLAFWENVQPRERAGRVRKRHVPGRMQSSEGEK